MNYRDYLQKVIYKIINPLINGMFKAGITPNIVTTIGFLGNLVATGLFVHAAYIMGDVDGTDPEIQAKGMAQIGWGGGVILFSGLFDMMDGRLARIGHLESSFGALWDSTLDRYSELISLFGICLIFLRLPPHIPGAPMEGFWWGVITFAAMVGSVMVSYVRARAEALGISCKVGFMQRPERVVVTALTALIAGCSGKLWWLAGGMCLIAVLANLTAFWRVGYCYLAFKKKA